MLFDLTLGIQLLLAFCFSSGLGSGLGLCGSLGFRGELLALAGACRQHNDQDDQQDQDYGADSDQQQLTLAQTKGAERRRNFLCGILEIGNGNIVRTDICLLYTSTDTVTMLEERLVWTAAQKQNSATTASGASEDLSLIHI